MEMVPIQKLAAYGFSENFMAIVQKGLMSQEATKV
jgi:hypothetical protein